MDKKLREEIEKDYIVEYEGTNGRSSIIMDKVTGDKWLLTYSGEKVGPYDILYVDGCRYVERMKGEALTYITDSRGCYTEQAPGGIFYSVKESDNGWALVQQKKGGPYRFVNMNKDGEALEVSEEFYSATPYQEGFAKVQKKKGGPIQYRDMKGALISKLPENKYGQELFLSTDMQFFDKVTDKHGVSRDVLQDSDFTDNRFVAYIKQRELARYRQALEHAESVEEINRIKREYAFIVEEVNSRVEKALSDEYPKEKARREKKLLEATRKKALEEIKGFDAKYMMPKIDDDDHLPL